MTNKIILDDFEREYDTEIANFEVDLNDLKKLGVSDRVFASEIFLYKIYGDEIFESKGDDGIDASKTKKITKLSEAEKNENANLKKIFDEIENSKFDEELEVELGRVRG